MSAREKSDKKNAITARFNEKDILLKQEFDERDRAEKEVDRDSLELLERVHFNQTEALRAKHYEIPLTDEEKTIILQPVLLAPLPAPLPPPTEPIPTPLPAPLPPPAPELFELMIEAVSVRPELSHSVSINIGGSEQTGNTPFRFARDFGKGSPVKVIVTTSGDVFISPDMTQRIEFVATLDTPQKHTIIIGTPFEFGLLPELPKQVLPADVDGLTGLSHSIEFGLLQPPEAIGALRPVQDWGIMQKREFTLDEVRRTDAEILAFRLNINERFVNTEVMDFDYSLIRADDTTLEVPESAGEKIPTPSSQGYEYWNWAKFGAVFNGTGGDLRGAGIYKLIIRADTGGVMSGRYELWFKVI